MTHASFLPITSTWESHLLLDKGTDKVPTTLLESESPSLDSSAFDFYVDGTNSINLYVLVKTY